METWYRASASAGTIQEVKVISETKRMVLLDDNLKVEKESFFHKYCKTKDEAKQFLISHLQAKLNVQRNVLNALEKQIEEINQL